MRIPNKFYTVSKAVMRCLSMLGMLFFSAERCFERAVMRKSDVGGNLAKQPPLGGAGSLSPIPFLIKKSGTFSLPSNGGPASSSVQLAEKKRSQEERVPQGKIVQQKGIVQQEEIIQIIKDFVHPFIEEAVRVEQRVFSLWRSLSELDGDVHDNVYIVDRHGRGLNDLKENTRQLANAIQLIVADAKNAHLGTYPKEIKEIAEKLVEESLQNPNLNAKRSEALKVVKDQVGSKVAMKWSDLEDKKHYFNDLRVKADLIKAAIQVDVDKAKEETRQAAIRTAAVRAAAIRAAAIREVSADLANMNRNATIGSVRAGDECAICMDVLSLQQEGLDSLVYLPLNGKNCGHIFHLKCIGGVVMRDDETCPTCRTAIPTEIITTIRKLPSNT